MRLSGSDYLKIGIVSVATPMELSDNQKAEVETCTSAKVIRPSGNVTP